MKELYEDEEFDFPVAYFLMPNGVEETSVCTVSGLRSNGSCPSTTDLIIKSFNKNVTYHIILLRKKVPRKVMIHPQEVSDINY
ncbi:MAG: hypothetical protein R2942_05980 [Ignavibacteria bacterium]